MAKRIVVTVLVMFVLAAGCWAYLRRAADQRLRDGDVTTVDEANRGGDTASSTEVRSDPPSASSQARFTGNANTQSASLAPLQAQNEAVPADHSSAAPVVDTESPNAPNGMMFAGTGRFQVYRQGNLTWRVNTEDGSTCILFATHEEWRKPDVYQHGCGNS